MTRIETPRLVIRTFEATDAEAWLAMMNDPAVNRYLPPWGGASLEGFGTILSSRHAMEEDLGLSMWAVEERETRDLLGQCGVRPIPEDEHGEIELAYHYRPASWGQGFATEAAVAVLSHGLRALLLERIVALVMEGNVASWRVAEKAVMREDGRASYFGLDDLRKYVAERAVWEPPT